MQADTRALESDIHIMADDDMDAVEKKETTGSLFSRLLMRRDVSSDRIPKSRPASAGSTSQAKRPPNQRPSTAIEKSSSPVESSPIVETPTTPSNVRPHRYSVSTMERSIAAKIYLENHFDKLFTGKSTQPNSLLTRTRRRIQIEHELDSMGMSEDQKMQVREAWLERERAQSRISREKITPQRFQPLKPLGRGAFGKVQLVRDCDNDRLYAMKVLKKEEMIRQHQEPHVRAERDLLSEAAADIKCKWLVKLMYSFQDADHLYFVMDYCPGGDLLGLLIQWDVFPEGMAKGYAAEMTACIEEVHRLGYVHRDLKPDNFLLDREGHLRLGDCGLATDFHWSHETRYYEVLRRYTYKRGDVPVDDLGEKDDSGVAGVDNDDNVGGVMNNRIETSRGDLNKGMINNEGMRSNQLEDPIPLSSKENPSPMSDSTDLFCQPPASHRILTWRARQRHHHPHARTYSIVGTNNYIAPEVVQGKPYDYSCDWWSLGVIVFEMVYGYPPFASQTREGTRMKIVDWKRWLKFPSSTAGEGPSAAVGGKGPYGEGEVRKAEPVSRECRDLIRKLLTDAPDRLGSVKPPSGLQQRRNSSDTPSELSSQTGNASAQHAAVLSAMLLGRDSQEVKKHSWFKQVDWERLKDIDAPWRPELSGEEDTRYFDTTGEELNSPKEETTKKNNSKDFKKDVKDNNSKETSSSSSSPRPKRSSSETDGDDSSLSSSVMDLRKKLAFTGFTYKGMGQRLEFVTPKENESTNRRSK